MALVLAFGVQDVAEAINVPPNPTTDVVDYTNIREINSTTRISPAVSLNSSTSSEGVTITVSGGVEIITPVALATGADLVLTEGDHDGDGTAGSNLNGRFFNKATNLGISSFSVSVRFTAAGEQTVRIEDTTSLYIPARTGSSWIKTYVFYVVGANSKGKQRLTSITMQAGLFLLMDTILDVLVNIRIGSIKQRITCWITCWLPTQLRGVDVFLCRIVPLMEVYRLRVLVAGRLQHHQPLMYIWMGMALLVMVC